MIAPGLHTLADGRSVEVVEISAGRLRARVATLGAAVLNLWAPGADGRVADVVLGHATLDGYVDDPAYLGVAVGRTAGRVAGACLTVDGVAHRLVTNEGLDTLHGGPDGLHSKVWSVDDWAPDRVALSTASPDGEGGYPGRLSVRLVVSLAEIEGTGALVLDWHAEADRPTPASLTHHTYWNLDGHGAGSICGHVLRSPADRYLALDGTLPTGATPRVTDTSLNLSRPRSLDAVLDDASGPVAALGGLDHDLLVAPFGVREAPLRPALLVASPAGGRSLDVRTTEPGVHLYDGAHLDVTEGKGGLSYGPRTGLAVHLHAVTGLDRRARGLPATLGVNVRLSGLDGASGPPSRPALRAVAETPVPYRSGGGRRSGSAPPVLAVRLWRDGDGAARMTCPHAVRHSPSGPEWGYGGSGPADCARSVLLALADEATADAHYQAFKADVISRVPEDGAVISRATVAAWLAGQVAPMARPSVGRAA